MGRGYGKAPSDDGAALGARESLCMRSVLLVTKSCTDVWTSMPRSFSGVEGNFYTGELERVAKAANPFGERLSLR